MPADPAVAAAMPLADAPDATRGRAADELDFFLIEPGLFMRSSRHSRQLLIGFVLLASCGRVQTSTSADPELVFLSTRPELVTGGNVLVGIRSMQQARSLEIRVGARDVTHKLKAGPIAGVVGAETYALVGLLDELPPGETTLRFCWQPMGFFARIQCKDHLVRNHSVNGPILSGPQERPFVCESETFKTLTGLPLGPPLDSFCNITTRFERAYRRGEKWIPWNEGESLPPDAEQIELPDRGAIPFVIQIETGTINRGIYQIVLLDDVAGKKPLWNQRLIYSHGGGCRQGWYRQGSGTGPIRAGLLAKGYAVASSSLNVFGTNCNDLVASETSIMVKERFVERHGVPLFTIGTGDSGGSVQSHLSADNYPGLFDGLVVTSSFADVLSTNTFTLADARLLFNYFDKTALERFTVEQQDAITGFRQHTLLEMASRNAARIDAVEKPGNPPATAGAEFSENILQSERYHPGDNPNGARGTIYDHMVNVLGKTEHGKVGRPLDNEGIQYGLAAFFSGQIDAEGFLHLNEHIGGFDEDGQPMPERHRADPGATKAALRSGRFLFGGGGLAQTPIIDLRNYGDDDPKGDIHMLIHQFSTRARLNQANGNSDNQIMWLRPNSFRRLPVDAQTEEGLAQHRKLVDSRELFPAFDLLDRWLTAVLHDQGPGSRAEKVRRYRPHDATDTCWITNGDGFDEVREVLDMANPRRCLEAFPPSLTPRHVAGAPIANNVVKCQLRQLRRSDYGAAIDDEQWNRLQTIFTTGVCDWAKPGVFGEGTPKQFGGTWQRSL
jgi:Tannase-like family of unknown function (DUF6351)